MTNNSRSHTNPIVPQPPVDIIAMFPNTSILEFRSVYGVKGCRAGGSRPTSMFIFCDLNEDLLKTLQQIIHPHYDDYYVMYEPYDADTFRDKLANGYFDEFKCTHDYLKLLQLLD